VHLTVGSVYLELAGFCKALEAFQHAHKIAQGIQDPALELQVIPDSFFSLDAKMSYLAMRPVTSELNILMFDV
jgi:hypothetical protein